MKLDKPKLRNALKKLRAIPLGDADPAELPMLHQEMLDFLAMVAGLKRVYLLGRGFAPPGWVSGVAQLADDMGLHVVAGPKWTEPGVLDGLADWMVELQRRDDTVDAQVFYVTRSAATAAEIQVINTLGAAPTSDQIAALLGYPLCCVKTNTTRENAGNRAFQMLAERYSGGDPAELKRLIAEDVQMTVSTAEEEALLKECHTLRPAPFTSVNMCDACAGAINSPAKRLAGIFRDLAQEVDARLAADIERVHLMFARFPDA